MFINKIYISSFGNLRALELDLNDKLNVFCKENGYGKSTIASFIKAIFYGLSNERHKSIEENERIKFKTWNTTEKIGGYIIFTYQGKVLRLERYFGEKASEDTVNLFDEQTGKQYKDTNNIGERILKINKEGFVSSTFFTQNDLVVKDKTSLIEKYNEIFENEDNCGYDDVSRILDNKIKYYKSNHSNNKGKITEVTKEISYLKAQLAERNNDKKSLSDINIKLDEFNKQKIVLESQIDDLTKEIIRANNEKAIIIKQNRLSELRSEKENFERHLKSLNDILNGNDLSVKDINACRENVLELNKAQGVLENTRVEKPEQKKSKVNIYITISLFLLIFSVIMIPLRLNVLAISGFVLLAILIIYSVYAEKKVREYNNKSDISYNLQKKEYDDFKDKFNQNLQKIELFLNRFKLEDRLNYFEKLDLLVEIFNKISYLSEQIEKTDVEIRKLLTDGEVIQQVRNTDTSKIEQDILNLKQKRENIASEINNLSVKHHYFNDRVCEIESIENKISNANENLCDYVKHYNLLSETKRFIDLANENIKQRYKAPLEDAFKKYYNCIDSGKEFNVDVDFNVNSLVSGKVVSQDYFSVGYKDLFEICKRFALIDVLYKEKPFIILDDPFVNLDDEKLCKAKQLIISFSERYQILYFTCHDSRNF